MQLHHIALGAHDVDLVASFYRDTFGLAEVARHSHDNGELRAVWLSLEGVVLMVEHTDARPRRVEGIGAGPFLLALKVTPEERRALEDQLITIGVPIEARTAYTSYVRDPEGNRVGFSHFPLPA